MPRSSASVSQTARVTLTLREMLIQGRFRPGERIREVPLAAQLNVSRIPLRLALERLAHEGLLEIRPTRGFVVQGFTTEDIYDAIELRGALEGTAARLAAERLEDASEASLLLTLSGEILSVVRAGGLTIDVLKNYIDLNARFHAEVLRLSGSRLLRRALEQASALPFASPSAFVSRHYAEPESRELFLIAADQHRGIADAIASREGMRAETLAREHARVARRNLENALKNRKLAKLVPDMKMVRL